MESLSNMFSPEDLAAILSITKGLLSGVGIFILGWMLSRWVYKLILNRLGNNKGLKANDTVRPLIATVAKYAILLAAIYAGLTQAGIAASSLLAVFGAAGLAIALAVQGTLANVAAGIMLIFLRSMKVGEYIETPNVAGTVLEIGLFTTQIKRADGVFISAPNAQIWGSQITNYSRFKTRRVDINIELSRDNDLARATQVVRDTLDKQKAVLNKDATDVVLAAFSANTATLQSRLWLSSDDLRAQSSLISLALHEALRAQGFKLPKYLP
jgi:small conductance mechanosensitive channel